jgi:hypothetical protein
MASEQLKVQVLHDYILTSLVILFMITSTAAETVSARQAPDTVAGIPVNYDESLTGTFQLPDPLTFSDGEKVDGPEEWYDKRRPEILGLFYDFQYGRTPSEPDEISYDLFENGSPAFDGTAIRKQVTIYLTGDEDGPGMDLLIYLPAENSGPVPLLLEASFSPNYSRVNDPGVKRGEMWNRQGERVPAPESSNFGRMNISRLIANGFGIATVYYGDIEPDFIGGFKHGIISHFQNDGQDSRLPNDWGAISAWAWGISRAMDYFEQDDDIDQQRIALMGVSRLGKTVLWAAARDTRFRAVIASCSGEGGAALSRRNFGETVAHLTAPTRFAYQFSESYGLFASHIHYLPVDANLLLALIAPRPLLLQTGSEDLWSDPKGEFLAARDASRVYEFLGARGLQISQWPEAGVPAWGTLSYYMHEGGHGTLPSDWEIFMEFLNTHLINRKTDE